ncbi:hypothetical protein OPT61_g19 [Boeremia exigua]|uniref:Uncharacterized protein n=1 Tax=Boeremia exigua TaxID=749465 RepID=A0ACC2IVP2_9PLEO|nr:hypothetical protein OPT61_g19 [Boeremia exigua]
MEVEPRTWIELAETTIFRTLGKPTVANIQAILILGLYRSYNNQSGKTFLYLSLAVRMAFSLKLHKDDSNLSFIERESRRRLLWCLYTVDRLCAGGVPEYTLLPVNAIKVQLPSPEHNYKLDLPIETPFLQLEGANKSVLSIPALMLCLLNIRHRILQYAKHLLNTNSSPEASLDQFHAFEQELKKLNDFLPEELSFSVRAFQLRAFSPDRTTFLMYHIYFHHCHCELYRLLNPGYREALPQDIIDATTSSLVSHAQSKCLEHAVAIGEIIASTQDLVDSGPYVSDAAFFVVLYQASCAILYACHRDSPAYNMSADIARPYFCAFIGILRKLLIYFPRYVVFVKDIQNMLRSIEDPQAPLPIQRASGEVDFRIRQVSSEENSDDGLHPKNLQCNATNQNVESLPGTAQLYGPMDDDGFSGQALQSEPLLDSSWPSYVEDGYNDADLDQSVLWNWAALLGSDLL